MDLELLEKIKMTNKLIVRIATLLIFVVLLIGQFPIYVAALSDAQKKMFDSGIGYFDVNACSQVESSSQNLSTGNVNNIYMVGDSVTVGLYYVGQKPLKDAFDKKGWSADVDAWGARSLDRLGQKDVYGNLPGRDKSGLDAIKADTDAIKKSDTVIIALGTNASNGDVGDFKQQATDAVKLVRKANESANIFWVNISAVYDPGNNYRKHVDDYNKAIDEIAGKQNIQVIDAAKASIELQSDKIHPSDAGYKQLSKVIIDGLSSSTKTGQNADSDTADTNKLSKADKIARTFLVGFGTNTSKSTIEDVVKKYKIGGIFILGNDAGGAGFNQEFFDKLNKLAGHQLVIASDEEGGSIARYKYDFDFPNAAAIGKMSDEEVKDLGQKVGEALANNGVNTDLAPVLDVAQDSSNTIATTKGRAFSDKASKVTIKAGAFAEGLRAAGINPVYKHFPGLGSANANTDEQTVTTISLDKLKQNDLKPYKDLLGKDAAVMMNNSHVPGLTKSGEVASTSNEAVKLLRDDYKFDGLVMTDDLNAAGVGVSLSNAIVKSMEAGVDMPLFTYTGTDVLDSAISKARDADLSLDSSLKRINAFVSDRNNLQAQANTTSNGCACIGNVELSGSENQEKAFNFFVGKGLTAIQAAGIVGNMMEESGVEPQRMQGIFDRKVPAEEWSDINGGGWGIVQWTKGSKFINPTKAAGKDPNDLGVQLEFVWDQLEGKGPIPESQAGKEIRSTNTLRDAVEAFMGTSSPGAGGNGKWYGFERPGDQSENNVKPRLNNAMQVLAKYGSGGGANASTSECGSPASESADFEIKKLDTPMATPGGKINPKGITLHWWGTEGDRRGIEGLVSDLSGNPACHGGCSVQVGITHDGKVYQLTKNLTDLTYHATGANTTTIGIEIQGGPADFGKDGIEKYPKKFEAVVATVQFLKDKYDIPLRGSVVCGNVSGIHPHKAYNRCRDGNGSTQNKTDIDDYYYRKVMERIK